MELDIRNGGETSVTRIRFGGCTYDYVELQSTAHLSLATNDGGLVLMRDIDNLILALQKAKELWGEGK